MWLAGIVVASAVVRVVMALPVSAPWIFPDELIYGELARSFAQTGHFAVRGDAFSAWSFGPLYPIAIAPAYRLFDPATAFVVVKALNSVLFSLAAIPAYLVGQRVLSRGYALVLAGLAVLVPSAVYTSKLMTESLAYPAFLLAVLAIVRVVERPTWRREVVAVGAIAVAALARGQLIVLLPALMVTLVVVAAFDERDGVRGVMRRLSVYRVTWLTALFGLAFAVLAASTGTPDFAGTHDKALSGVSAASVLASFAYHLAGLDLYVGVLPVAALACVCSFAFRGSGDRTLRALCTLTIASSVLLAATAARYLVAVYADDPDPYPRVFDRYEFYAAPLLLAVFLVWVERGLPRPSATTAWLAGGAAALLPAILPLSHLLNGRQWGTNSSNVALVPLAIVRLATGTMFAVYGALAMAAVCLAYAFVRSTRPQRLVSFVALNFLVVMLLVQVGNTAVAGRALGWGIGSANERTWIDDSVGPHGDVAALWSGVAQRTDRGWYGIWENELFNDRVGRVYDLREPMRYGLPAVKLRTHGRDLLLPNDRPWVADYVLTDVKTPLVGRQVAADTETGMVLVRVDGPVRLR